MKRQGLSSFAIKGASIATASLAPARKKAPGLDHMRKDKNWPPEKITQQILNGGRKMPPFADSLTDPEVAQIVAYLRAKHKPLPPPPAGD